MKIKKAVITAAGWGTRFLPLTKSQPKEMLPLLDKPLIQYSIEEAIACGVQQVVIVVGRGKRAIMDYFARDFELEQMLRQKGEAKLLEEVRRLSNMADINYVLQKEPLGLGHAVLTARKMIGDEPFLLLLPDDFFGQSEAPLRRMIEIYRKYQGAVVAVKSVTEQEVRRYGIVACTRVADRIYQVTNSVEKPDPDKAPSNLAIMGRYVLVPEIFAALQQTPPGRTGELQLTDALAQLLKQRALYAYEFTGERWDAGTFYGWLEATVALALRHPQAGSKLRDYLRRLASGGHR